ncbi:MAG: citrate lyase holo-[Bacteroidales bacterium]|nr:citrate lyase holo-[acyl-carrier protein] synthase [Bacteroidales bacterium]
MEITLEQLLEARDRRYERQLALAKEWPGRTLVCMTVVLPGPVKRDARSLKVAEAGVKAVQDVFTPVHKELYDRETGFEGFFVVDGALLDVKKACCEIENEHPVGRLMDLDVLEPVGETIVPVERERVGEPPRKCLVCGRPARECMRSHAHPFGEIEAAIDRIVGAVKKP